MFVKHFPKEKLVIIIVYVDDIIVIGDLLEEIQLFKDSLAKKFEIRDLGNLKYFLSMEIGHSRKGILVS